MLGLVMRMPVLADIVQFGRIFTLTSGHFMIILSIGQNAKMANHFDNSSTTKMDVFNFANIDNF